MKFVHVALIAVAAVSLSACCYRPVPRPCAPAAPSYCAPVCATAPCAAKVYRSVEK
jgi:hypothetical protein